MRVLLIKMSSMGDVFHMFPALSDAMRAIPDLQIDWVVEKDFAEIPSWHPVINQVLPVELRKWRKAPFNRVFKQERKTFFDQFEAGQYDLIVDAQGLYKSVWVGRKISKRVGCDFVGLDWYSVREPLAALFYHRAIRVAKAQHAITRLRELMAKALVYSVEKESPLDYQITLKNHQAWWFLEALEPQNYTVFLHGTTWETKYWPEESWIALGQQLLAEGQQLVIAWGSDEEKQRANRIKQALGSDRVFVTEVMATLNEMVQLFQSANSVVAVDTGLSHVAAALNVPMVVLYRVTDPALVGAKGQKVENAVSPLATDYIKSFENAHQAQQSLEGVDVETVKKRLQQAMKKSG